MAKKAAQAPAKKEEDRRQSPGHAEKGRVARDPCLHAAGRNARGPRRSASIT